MSFGTFLFNFLAHDQEMVMTLLAERAGRVCGLGVRRAMCLIPGRWVASVDDIAGPTL